MADVYAGSLATAIRLITKYGRSMTIKRATLSGATPWSPTVTTSDTTAIGVVTSYRSNEINGTLIQAGDKRILMMASAAPATGNHISDGSVVYAVIDVEEVKPGGTVIFYKVQARK